MHAAYQDKMIYPSLDVAELFCQVSSVHLSAVVGNRLVKNSLTWVSTLTDHLAENFVDINTDIVIYMEYFKFSIYK